MNELATAIDINGARKTKRAVSRPPACSSVQYIRATLYDSKYLAECLPNYERPLVKLRQSFNPAFAALFNCHRIPAYPVR
jgi:hypothetical protein